MRVEEAMTAEVVTVTPQTTVKEIAHLMREHHIGGMPVVDGEGKLVGMVGEADIIVKEMVLPFSAVKVPTLFRKLIVDRDELDLDHIWEEARDIHAVDVMEKDIVAVDAGEDIGRAAWLMAHNHKRRLPVLRDGGLVGIISRSDIVRLMARED